MLRRLPPPIKRHIPTRGFCTLRRKTFRPPTACVSSTTSRTTTTIVSLCRTTSSARYRSRRSCSSASCKRSLTRWRKTSKCCASRERSVTVGERLLAVVHSLSSVLEKRKHNLEAKLEKVEHAIKSRTDDVVDFKQMGIDHIFIDESHYQNFLSFPILRDNWLIFIDFSLIQFGLFMDSFVRKEAPCLQA